MCMYLLHLSSVFLRNLKAIPLKYDHQKDRVSVTQFLWGDRILTPIFAIVDIATLISLTLIL